MSRPATPPQDADSAPPRPSFGARLKDLWVVEFSNLRFRQALFTALAALLPPGRAVTMRTTLLRLMGLRIGAGTRVLALPKIQSSRPGALGSRISVGRDCTIGARVILEFGEVLTIGDRVTLADGAVILTTTHELGPKEHRAGPATRTPVTLGDDVVIGENSIVLPGAVIGSGARVLPNSVVNAKVAPGATVSGIPARPQRSPA